VKSIWSGSISLSLLNMPVKLGTATQDAGLELHQVRKSDGSRIKYRRVAEADGPDGAEVPYHEVVKGYTAPDGSLVTLDQRDFKSAYGEKNRQAELVMFTDSANVPPMAVKSAYWVQPDKGGEKTYALLAGALQQTGKVAIVRYAMRDREAMAVLRPHDGYLSLETLEWDSGLVRPDFAAPAMSASQDEQNLALRLIESMDGKYDHAAQTDKSSEAVMTIIQGKIERGEVKAPAPRPDNAGAPADLTATLLASVAAQKKAKAPARAATQQRKAS
jgi:DNA end-binding protein Ku